MELEIERILGIPAHPLFAHIPVVLLPLAALAAAVCAVSRRWRRRIGWAVVGLSVALLVVVQLTVGSGEELEDDVRESELVEDHAALGDTLLPLTAGFAAAVTAMVAVDAGSRRRSDTPPPWARIALPVLCVLTVGAAVATGVQTYRAGHSGAEAVWDDPSRPMLEP
jgi:hypothetical protein